jgi:OmpA family protein
VRQAFYAGTFQHSLHDFARGSAALTKAHTDELDAMELGRHFLLVGANDASKGPEDNPALSVQRAQAVKDYLVNKRKVDAGTIDIEGHGVEAREPNPQGTQVAANRRVDIRIDYGQAGAPTADKGSRAEQRLMPGFDWRTTLDNFVNDLTRLRDIPGTIPWKDWSSLLAKQRALNLWRRRDPTVPDVNEIYKSELSKLKARAAPEPDPTKDKVPRPQAVDDPALKVKPLDPPKSFPDPGDTSAP